MKVCDEWRQWLRSLFRNYRETDLRIIEKRMQLQGLKNWNNQCRRDSCSKTLSIHLINKNAPPPLSHLCNQTIIKIQRDITLRQPHNPIQSSEVVFENFSSFLTNAEVFIGHSTRAPLELLNFIPIQYPTHPLHLSSCKRKQKEKAFCSENIIRKGVKRYPLSLFVIFQ